MEKKRKSEPKRSQLLSDAISRGLERHYEQNKSKDRKMIERNERNLAKAREEFYLK